MAKKSIVQLRVYRGERMSYDEQGKAQNENQPIKLQYNTFEWERFLGMLHLNGFVKVEVERFLEVEGHGKDEKVKEITPIPKEIIEEVKEALLPKNVKAETPEQKQIRELQEQVAKLTNGASEKKEKKEKKEEKAPETTAPGPKSEKTRDELIAEYEELFGKKVFNGWSDEKIAEKIASKN